MGILRVCAFLYRDRIWDGSPALVRRLPKIITGASATTHGTRGQPCGETSRPAITGILHPPSFVTSVHLKKLPHQDRSFWTFLGIEFLLGIAAAPGMTHALYQA